MTQSIWLARLAPLLPCLVAVVLFLPCVNFEFIWDDSSYLVQQHALPDWPQAWHAAFSAYLQGSRVYFRPLPILTWAFDLLPDGGARAAHRTNVLLHAANSGLVAVLAGFAAARLGRTARQIAAASALAGILYAAHPALIQTAAWISCRFDLLLTCFGLLFLIADRKLEHSAARPWVLGLLFFLAALCKETAVVLPLLLPFWRRYFAPVRLYGAVALKEWAALFAAGAAYLILRHQMLRDIDPAHIPWLPPAQQLLLVLKSIGGYVWLTLCPFALLNPLHPLVLPLLALDAEVVTGAAAMCAVLWCLRSPRPLVQLGLCYALTLLPAINLLRFNLTDYEQERFLTLPLVFAGILAAQLAVAFHGNAAPQTPRRIFALALPGAWLAMSGLALLTYLPVWSSNLSLWSYALAREPASATAQKYALISLNALGRTEQAAALGRALEQRHPDDLSPDVRFLYARALSQQGVNEEALRQLDLLAGAQPGDDRKASLCAEGGWMELARGQPQRAEALLRAALLARAENAEALYQLGIALQAQGRMDEGARRIDEAGRLAPESAAGWKARAPSLVADVKTLTSQAQGAPEASSHAALDRLCVNAATPAS